MDGAGGNGRDGHLHAHSQDAVACVVPAVESATEIVEGAEGAGGVGMTKDHQVIRAAFSVYGIVAAEIRALIDKEPQA